MDIRNAAFGAEIAFTQHSPKPINLSPVSPPEPDWQAKLTGAWPEIERLAERLLSGDSPIHLSNGQQLIRDTSRAYDFWWDPNTPTVDDEDEN